MSWLTLVTWWQRGWGLELLCSVPRAGQALGVWGQCCSPALLAEVTLLLPAATFPRGNVGSALLRCCRAAKHPQQIEIV